MSAGADLRLGIDVGGTNTDAAVLDRQGALVAKAKRPTSADVTGGITAALNAVSEKLDTATLIDLNTKVSVDKLDSAQVAQEWVAANIPG